MRVPKYPADSTTTETIGRHAGDWQVCDVRRRSIDKARRYSLIGSWLVDPVPEHRSACGAQRGSVRGRQRNAELSPAIGAPNANSSCSGDLACFGHRAALGNHAAAEASRGNRCRHPRWCENQRGASRGDWRECRDCCVDQNRLAWPIHDCLRIIGHAPVGSTAGIRAMERRVGRREQ